MIITQEFFQKTILINLMREMYGQHGTEGIYGQSGESGQDNLLLCCPEWEGPDINRRLMEVAECFKNVSGQKLFTRFPSVSASSATRAGAVFPDVSKNGSGAEQKLLLGKGVQYPFGGGGAGCGGGPGGGRYK